MQLRGVLFGWVKDWHASGNHYSTVRRDLKRSAHLDVWVARPYKGIASSPVAFTYGTTVFGNTTSNTKCPDGNSGPCKVT